MNNGQRPPSKIKRLTLNQLKKISGGGSETLRGDLKKHLRQQFAHGSRDAKNQ